MYLRKGGPMASTTKLTVIQVTKSVVIQEGRFQPPVCYLNLRNDKNIYFISCRINCDNVKFKKKYKDILRSVFVTKMNYESIPESLANFCYFSTAKRCWFTTSISGEIHKASHDVSWCVTSRPVNQLLYIRKIQIKVLDVMFLLWSHIHQQRKTASMCWENKNIIGAKSGDIDYFGKTQEIAYITIYVLIRKQYSDATMDAMASQIISYTIVWSTVYSVTDQGKHQSSASLAFSGEFTGDRWMASNAANVSIWRCHHESWQFSMYLSAIGSLTTTKFNSVRTLRN